MWRERQGVGGIVLGYRGVWDLYIGRFHIVLVGLVENEW